MTLDASLFLSDAVHAREVELPSGTKHLLHFRELPAKIFRSYHNEAKADDEEKRNAATARLIAEGLCNEDGSPAITVERALQLKPAAFNAILKQVMVVNDLQPGNE